MFCFFCSKPLQGILNRLDHIERIIMATSAELQASIESTTAQVAKIGTETTALLALAADLQAALDAAVANSNTISPELVAAVDALKAQVTVVDDLVPDVPVAPV
jgi:hypothetical protein